jgi:outer membrane lipoprotein-sorting protein
MKIPFLIGLTGVAGALIAAQAGSADSLLEKHTKALQTATSFSADYTVQTLPGGPSAFKLKLAKPSKFKLETPDEIIIGDGTTVTDYKKADNTYSQAAQTPADLKALLKRDALISWTAFFTKEPFKDVTGIKAGNKHMVKGKPVTDVSMVLPGNPERSATLFLDADLGIARGISIKIDADKTTIVMAKEIAIAADSAKDSDFEFMAPDGAKKVDPTATIGFDKVASIFQQNCGGCHGGARPKAGYDLTTYAGAMAGGRNGKDIVPGDVDNSPIMLYLKASSGKPQMPPAGPLNDTEMVNIANWIKAGAKEK